MTRYHLFFSILLLFLVSSAIYPAAPPPAPSLTPDPAGVAGPADEETFDERSYRLVVRDQVQFRVQGEPETEVEQRIDGQGRVRLPYIGTVEIAGMTVREAETYLEETYVEAQIYVDPQVLLRVQEYASREVYVMGEVNRPGTIQFPIEESRLSIVSVITAAGGFTGIARSRAVRVTRRNEEGEAKVLRVHVDDILDGDGETFDILPGDIIYVPARFF